MAIIICQQGRKHWCELSIGKYRPASNGESRVLLFSHVEADPIISPEGPTSGLSAVWFAPVAPQHLYRRQTVLATLPSPHPLLWPTNMSSDSFTAQATRFDVRALDLLSFREPRSERLIVCFVVYLAQGYIWNRTCSLLLQWGPTTHAKVCTHLSPSIRCFNVDATGFFSAYLNLPISVQRIWVETTPDPHPSVPSEATPITQTRRVHLMVTPLPVDGAPKAPTPKIACIATSTVSITSPEAAKFFLDEKYAIGQTFRVLGRVAEFKLLEVSIIPASHDGEQMRKESLRRRYILRTDGFECDIEVRLSISIPPLHSHLIVASGSVP